MAIVRTGGPLKLVGEALLAWSLGRFFSTLFFDFFWSSISAIALILMITVGVFLRMAWVAEDMVAEKARMEVWQLRSHLYLLGGGFMLGTLGSILQWFAYTALPWLEAHL